MNYLDEVWFSDDDEFCGWCERLMIKGLSDEFYDNNLDLLFGTRNVVDEWLNKLFKKNIHPDTAAQIIERAFNIYLKDKSK